MNYKNRKRSTSRSYIDKIRGRGIQQKRIVIVDNEVGKKKRTLSRSCVGGKLKDGKKRYGSGRQHLRMKPLFS